MAWQQLSRTGRVEWVNDLAEIPAQYGVKNVYGDLGQIFAQSTMADPRVCAFMMGTLVKGLGADHVVWGSDAVWTGSPQWQIEALRRIEIPDDSQTTRVAFAQRLSCPIPAPPPSFSPARGGGMRWGWHHYTANAGFFDRSRDKSRSDHVLDKLAQVLRSFLMASGNTERLLYRHEAVVEDTRSGKLRGVGYEMLPHAGEDIDLSRDDQFERRIRAWRPHQLSVLQTPAQKQIVGAPARYANAYSLAVNVRAGTKRRAGRHEIGSFDFYIRSGEINLARPPRIDGEERDIPGTGFYRVEHYSGRLEANQLDGHAHAPAELPPQIGRHARKLAAGRISSRQDRVAIVDTKAQLARRRKIIL
jgi:hypothetical protein